MTPQQAKEILLLYRPGVAVVEDPDMTAALDLARQDPELGRWFEQHRAFQQQVRQKLNDIEVPAHFKTSLLARHAVPPPIITLPVWWRRPVALAAAAAILFLLGITAFWLQPRSANRFAHFQDRMVRTAIREYRMDLVTNDMQQVRRFLADHGAPANYDVPQGLDKLQLTGTGFLRWRSNPVAMVCFNRGDNQMLFLFVMNRSALPDPPGETPEVGRTADLVTASWSRGDKVYVLAGPEEPGFEGKYVRPKS